MDTNVMKSGRKITRKPETDRVTTIVEEQTKALPNIGFLAFALGSMALSAGFTFSAKRRELGNFIGLWVPTFLILGLYNKLVQVEDEVFPADIH